MINWVTQLSIKEKVKLFNKLYDELAGYGREGDTELAHVNPFEAKLLKAVGGSGTINPVTGLREYKGGGSSPPPPPAQQTVRQETTIPDELKPFVTDILEESQAQYRQRQEEGYVPYEGAQIAQFTPEQQQAFQATRGIFEQGLAGTPLGQSTTYLAPALGATTASTLPTTAATIGQYMDPYLENVLRVQEQEARRADEISRQGRAAQAVQAGAFGGSREAVMEAEAQRGLEDRLASLRASGMSQAYQTAQQMAEAQRARELAAGRQYAALGETAAQQQAREIGGLAATGEALRGQQQAALDIAKTQFIEEQQFPQTQLQQYSSIIRGFPLTPSQLETRQTVTPQPSLTQQLLGAGIGAAGLAGAFGAFKKEGGLVGLAEGGRPMDAMPMAAMPMKPRRRAADLGSAIGDLAKRMGTGRSMSQIGGGLTSVLSAPAMSQNMQQMMPQQASATPMQMPSQRFMNAGGKVGYYQQGTGSETVANLSLYPQDMLAKLVAEGKITPQQRQEEINRRFGRVRDPRTRQRVEDQSIRDTGTTVLSQGERPPVQPVTLSGIGGGEFAGMKASPSPYGDVPSIGELRERAMQNAETIDQRVVAQNLIARSGFPGTGADIGLSNGEIVAAVPAGTSAPAPTQPSTSGRLGDYSIEIPKLLQKIEEERKNITNNMAALSELNKNNQIKRDEFLRASQDLGQQQIDINQQRKELISTRMNQSPEHQAFKERLAKLTDEKTRQDELKSDFDKQAFLDLARFGFGVASNVDWASEAGKAIENFAETKKEERAAKRDLSKEVTNAMALELDLSDKERNRLEGLQDQLLNTDEKSLAIATANIDTIRQLDKEAANDFITELATKNNMSKETIDQTIDLIDKLGDIYEGIETAQAKGADYDPVPDSVLNDIVNSSGIAALKGYEPADFKNAFRDEAEPYLKRVGAGKGQATTIASRLAQDEEFMKRVRNKMERYRAARSRGQIVQTNGSGNPSVTQITKDDIMTTLAGQ